MAVFSNGVAGMVLFKIGKNMYNPLPDGVTIKHSPIHGLGLFTTCDIKEHHEFGITHVEKATFGDPTRFSRNQQKPPVKPNTNDDNEEDN